MSGGAAKHHELRKRSTWRCVVDEVVMNVAAPPRLTIRDIRAVGVEVPMTYALGTSRGAITRAPLMLIDVETAESVTGRSYLFCYLRAAAPGIACMLGEILEATKGVAIAPVELWGKLAKRFALIGVQGIVRMAMAGVDI